MAETPNYGLSLAVPQFQVPNFAQAYLGGVQANQNQQELDMKKPYYESQTAANNVDTGIKQIQTINSLTGSVMSSDPMQRSTAYKLALQQARGVGLNLEGVPQEWGPDAEAFVQNAYTSSGQQLEQLKIATEQRRLAIADKQLQQGATLTTGNTVQVTDPQTGKPRIVTINQAVQEGLSPVPKSGMNVYDSQGNLIVSTGGSAAGQAAGGTLTPNAATDLQKQDNKAISDIRKSAQEAQDQTASIPGLRQALDSYGYTGAGGSVKQLAAKAGSLIGLGNETASTGDYIESESAKIALFNRKNMPGSMSDSDRQFLMNMAAGLDKNPQGNKLILDQAEATKDRLVQKTDFFEQFRKTNGNLTGATAAWNRYITDNPIVQSNDAGQVTGIKVPQTPFDAYLMPQNAQQKQPTSFTTQDGKAVSPEMIDGISKAKGISQEEVIKAYGLKPQAMNEASSINPTQRVENVQQVAMMDQPSHMKLASAFLGADENTGKQTLSAFFRKSLGKDIDPSKTPWCAAYVNSVLQNSGIDGTGSLAARSFLRFGTSTDDPSKGDVVVLARGSDPSKGHVGFFDGYETINGKQYVRILGGNQDNTVSVKSYPASKVLAFRKPPKPAELQRFAMNNAGMQ